MTEPLDLEAPSPATSTEIATLRDALNAYHNARTEAERRAANEQVLAMLKQRQWTWETRD